MGYDLQIHVPAEGALGPAMNALPNDRQRAFVCALLEYGDNNHTRAAACAGYTGNDNTIRVTAHRLSHDELVLAAMHEEASRRMNAGKVMATSKLLEIAADTTHKDQLKAVLSVLDRTGLHAKTEHTVKVRDESRTEDAMIERIKQLGTKLGLQPEEQRKLLASAGVIDAEFTVVEPTKEEWE